ncbi:MAG TPA: DNA-binding response regulator [Firmicutes bacterium]|nr:DNA-binding response regulator [Bacillota bacterium]
MPKTILLIEDEVKIRAVVRAYLERAGFRVIEEGSGDAGLQSFAANNPDLVILDLMLPGLSGWEVCRRLRATSAVPVIMLTARNEEQERIDGLQLGADDYVGKPFSPKELVARVQAVLRRTLPEVEKPLPPLQFEGGLIVNRLAHEGRIHDQVIPLTAAEYRILALLAARPRQALTRQQIVESAFGYDYDGDERTIDAHIKNLRRKIARYSVHNYIETVYGIGYRFSGEQLEGRDVQ